MLQNERKLELCVRALGKMLIRKDYKNEVKGFPDHCSHDFVEKIRTLFCKYTWVKCRGILLRITDRKLGIFGITKSLGITLHPLNLNSVLDERHDDGMGVGEDCTLILDLEQCVCLVE